MRGRGLHTQRPAMQPGYDGEAFELEQVRDHAGRGKRELVRRVRYDVLDWLFARGLIDLHQRETARRLQVDNERSLSLAMPKMRFQQRVDGAQDFGLRDAASKARRRCDAAEAQIGPRLWPVVKAVVVDNVNIGAAAKALRMDRLRVVPRLRDGLDVLAGFYGLGA